jgi:hypothetical protein
MINRFILKKLHDDYVNSFDPNNADNHLHMDKLRKLREYLDSKGLRMPNPKWKFNFYDYTTWPILPGRIVRDLQKNPVRHKPYQNPNFLYKHLL